MATILRSAAFAPPITRKFFATDVIPNLLLLVLAGSNLPPTSLRVEQSFDVSAKGRYYHQLPDQSAIQTLGIPPLPPVYQRVRAASFAPGFQAKYLQVFDPPNVTITQPKTARIFRLPLYTEINRYSASRDYQSFETTVYLPAVSRTRVDRQPLQIDLRPYRYVPQDFYYNGTLIQNVKPFLQSDWPLFARKPDYVRDHTQGSIQNLGIPATTILPFNISDYPLYARKSWAQGDSYASPQILLVTVNRPFRQNDQPNPNLWKIVPQDFAQTGFFTRQKVVPPFYQTDFLNPYKYLATPQAFIEEGFTTRGIPPAVPPIPPPGFFPLANYVGLGWLHASHLIILAKLYQTQPPIHKFSKVYPNFTVIEQYPPPGTLVTKNTAIQLTVSNNAYLPGATFGVIPLFGRNT